MASCRSAPVSPGTWTASPGCVPPPTARAGWVFSPDWSNFSSPIRRMCGWYPASATVPWPVGLSYPLSKHRFWTPSGRSTTMLSSVGLSSFVSWTLAPATTTLSGPPGPVDQDAFLAPSLAPVRGIAVQWRPPQTRLSHGAIGGLPFPIYAVQLPAFFDQGGPDTLNHPTLDPTLEGPVDGAVIPQLLGASGSIGRSYAYGR